MKVVNEEWTVSALSKRFSQEEVTGPGLCAIYMEHKVTVSLHHIETSEFFFHGPGFIFFFNRQKVSL